MCCILELSVGKIIHLVMSSDSLCIALNMSPIIKNSRISSETFLFQIWGNFLMRLLFLFLEKYKVKQRSVKTLKFIRILASA